MKEGRLRASIVHSIFSSEHSATPNSMRRNEKKGGTSSTHTEHERAERDLQRRRRLQKQSADGFLYPKRLSPKRRKKVNRNTKKGRALTSTDPAMTAIVQQLPAGASARFHVLRWFLRRRKDRQNAQLAVRSLAKRFLASVPVQRCCTYIFTVSALSTSKRERRCGRKSERNSLNPWQRPIKLL